MNDIETIELTPSQKRALLLILQGYNVFLSGFAGTGKTWLLKMLAQLTGSPVNLYATFGLAAINLGGVTVSSHAALKLGLYKDSDD
jgi:ATP-dependent DNA helicase PIF1